MYKEPNVIKQNSIVEKLIERVVVYITLMTDY